MLLAQIQNAQNPVGARAYVRRALNDIGFEGEFDREEGYDNITTLLAEIQEEGNNIDIGEIIDGLYRGGRRRRVKRTAKKKTRRSKTLKRKISA